ncbi:hypothetical protein WL21_09840 [Burkholderia ubonensis]|uniref:hypothetical protein n=1 Tax=Burkholderia ubonensis TaxID=101571 RepID=UPI000758DE53|nr:hypothetical protein [Burkholderia ubonensis]KVO83324.1 hypothetical protein WJ81_23060 [Burkholderia ubonensis]KVZ58971.1 hypothetical protein WL20_20460 [Burkholderia ubonensis]KVZ70599.1 hypothetical protein WL21_09840 [Burkholderia ubonensis]
MADKKIIWAKNGQVYAITFPGERSDNTYGTAVAEVDLDVEVSVGDVYPPVESTPAPAAKKSAKN